MPTAIAGCPYSFSGSSLPGHIQTIAIPVFENESLDATIAEEVTRGVEQRFLDDNRLKVVREARADCIVTGKVTHYERRVYSYTPQEEPEEYIIIIRLQVVLKDRVKNKDLWSQDALEATGTFAASGSAAGGTAATEEEARENAITLLAQDILAKTLEQW